MTRQEAYDEYVFEAGLLEQWGAIDTTTFEEWLSFKNIKLED